MTPASSSPPPPPPLPAEAIALPLLRLRDPPPRPSYRAKAEADADLLLSLPSCRRRALAAALKPTTSRATPTAKNWARHAASAPDGTRRRG